MTPDPAETLRRSRRTAGRGAYLDHAATTPLRREAFEAMVPLLTEGFANPSGLHLEARTARRAVDDAREQVAEALGCLPGEVVFTSGGTEADNLAVTGLCEGSPGGVLVSAIEHRAVLEPARQRGARLVPVDPEGVVELDALDELILEVPGGPALVSVMLVNNETGVVQPIEAIGERVRELAPDALLHSDAVQAVSWCDVARRTTCCDLVSISGHKFGGPKGVGALVVRGSARPRLAPIVRGGGQEMGLRSGTENVPAIVAMAVALRAAVVEREGVARRVEVLRDRLADGLLAARPGGREPAGRARRIPSSCHLAFSGIDGEELCYLLDAAGVAASTGSACASGAREQSHVLAAMGWSRSEAGGAIRFSLGTTTTDEEIDHALAVVPDAIDQLRAPERSDAPARVRAPSGLGD